jgi:hypothetical protein
MKWALILSIIIIIVVLVGVCVLNYFGILKGKFFSDSSSLYYFSALLQSNAAIFSIFGVFVVFKIQSIQSSIDLIKSRLMNDGRKIVQSTDVVRFDDKDIDEKEVRISEIKDNGELVFHYTQWLDKEKEILKIKTGIKNPIVFIAIAIIMNALGLIMSSYIHQSGFNAEYLIMMIFLILEISLLITLISSINKML